MGSRREGNLAFKGEKASATEAEAQKLLVYLERQICQKH